MSRSLLTGTQGLRFGATCLNTAMQPRLLLLPISFHGLTTATVGTPNSVIQPLQKTQHVSARLVLLAPRHHPSTPLLEKLHWLPISERIKYKVACMCFSAINGSGPAYLSEVLTCLHSVSYTALFFWHPHAGNPTIQTQDSWLSYLLLLWTPHLEFTPTRP